MEVRVGEQVREQFAELVFVPVWDEVHHIQKPRAGCGPGIGTGTGCGTDIEAVTSTGPDSREAREPNMAVLPDLVDDLDRCFVFIFDKLPFVTAMLVPVK
jgi:hypothetical protein